MAKTTVKPHKKTILYIVAEGKEQIRPEVVECMCIETKGIDHVSARYHKEGE